MQGDLGISQSEKCVSIAYLVVVVSDSGSLVYSSPYGLVIGLTFLDDCYDAARSIFSKFHLWGMERWHLHLVHSMQVI